VSSKISRTETIFVGMCFDSFKRTGTKESSDTRTNAEWFAWMYAFDSVKKRLTFVRQLD